MNERIKRYARERGVKLWEVAYSYGISDATFSRKLRRELPTQEQEKIMEIINELAKEKEGR